MEDMHSRNEHMRSSRHRRRENAGGMNGRVTWDKPRLYNTGEGRKMLSETTNLGVWELMRRETTFPLVAWKWSCWRRGMWRIKIRCIGMRETMSNEGRMSLRMRWAFAVRIGIASLATVAV